MAQIKKLLILLLWGASVLSSSAQISPAPGVSVRDEGVLKGRASSFNFIGSGGVCEIVSGVAECTWNGVGTGLGEPGGDGIVVRSGEGNTVARTLTGTTGNLVCTNGNGVSGNPTCDVGSTIVQTDQANTYTTGLQNFNAATVTLPSPFNLGATSVTATGTEVNRLIGVTADIQTQFTAKAPLASPTFTGTVVIPTPFTLGAVSVLPTGTELNFVDGVTSAIQAQIDAKAPLDTPTLVTPTIASFVNATHTHQDTAGGGTLTEAALTLTDVTTKNATTSQHGFLPKLSGDPAQCLNGEGEFVTCGVGGGGGSSNSFTTMNAPTGTDPAADSVTDTLNWTATAPITITGDSTTDTLNVAVADATTIAKGAVELATDGETGSGIVVQGNDARLSNARQPTAHATTHQHGGTDEIATATPAASAIPKANSGGTLNDGWIASTVTRDTELDSFGEWITFTGITGTCTSGTYVRGDGSCQLFEITLGTSTTGNYVSGVAGTANEITVSHTPGEGSTATISLPTGISATKIAGGGVSSTEFDFLGTVTSNVQTQIDGKAPLDGVSLIVANLSGADAGAKIATCVSTLPSTGGICDARSLTGSQAISSNLTINKSNVTVLLGNATYVHSAGVRLIVSANDVNVIGIGDASLLDATAGTGSSSPISVTGSRALLKSFKLTGCRAAGCTASGIVAAGGADVIIDNLTVGETGGQGIAFNPVTRATARNNRITNVRLSGIFAGSGTAPSWIYNNDVTGSGLANAAGHAGITINGATTVDAHVVNNYIHSVMTNGIRADGSSPNQIEIAGNKIETTGVGSPSTDGECIAVTANNVKIHHNDVRGCWVSGILVFGTATDVMISENSVGNVSQVTGSSHAGIQLNPNALTQTNVKILDNQVWDDQGTATTSRSVTLTAGGTMTDILIRGNRDRTLLSASMDLGGYSILAYDNTSGTSTLDPTTVLASNSIGPTQIDETANYAFTGANTDNGNPIRGVLSSADCASEDIPARAYCINSATPWAVYFCPLATGLCDDPGESKALPTLADIADDQSLNDAATNGRFILGANSEANATIIACIDNNADNDCTDAGDSSIRFWIDPVNGPTMKSYPDGHISTVIPSGFAYILTGTAGEMERLTSAGVHTYTNVKPIKSVEPMGHGFGSCTYTEGVLNTSKPITGYFVCTDADADGFDIDWIAPDSWDAGTLTVEVAALSTNATPSGNLVMSCSGQSVRSADTIANRATTGEQTATMTFATTSKEQHATTSAITLQGTAAAGAHIYMHCDVDATGTTATMADVKIIATPKIEYAIGSRSDG